MPILVFDTLDRVSRLRPLSDVPRTSAIVASGCNMPDLPELDPVIHGKLRLAILSLLSSVDDAEFTWLRDKTGSTDGNLGAHLLKLEEAGYIGVEKKVHLAQTRDALPHDGIRTERINRLCPLSANLAGVGIAPAVVFLTVHSIY